LYQYCRSMSVEELDPSGLVSRARSECTRDPRDIEKDDMYEFVEEFVHYYLFKWLEKLGGWLFPSLPIGEVLEVVGAMPDGTRIAICAKYQEYLKRHMFDPDFDASRDPMALWLLEMCKIADSKGKRTLRRVFCGEYDPSNFHGPPAPGVESLVTSCPSSFTDEQCCDLASGGRTPKAVPPVRYVPINPKWNTGPNPWFKPIPTRWGNPTLVPGGRWPT